MDYTPSKHRNKVTTMTQSSRKLAGFLIGLLVSCSVLAADPVALKADHPERYVVVKGDTLWDIAGHFLQDPWYWPEIWHVNPQIANHGGFVSLVDVKGTDVIIQMGGGCQGCGMANVTLKNGVEVALKEALPEITAVYDVTDHASGKNPYYQGEKS